MKVTVKRGGGYDPSKSSHHPLNRDVTLEDAPGRARLLADIEIELARVRDRVASAFDALKKLRTRHALARREDTKDALERQVELADLEYRSIAAERDALVAKRNEVEAKR